MAQSLNFATGQREFRVNGSYTLRFNPTDTDFVRRFQATVESLKARQQAFEVGMPPLTGAIEAALDADDTEAVSEANRAMLAHVTETSDAMRADIDGLFGEGAADGIFPDGMSLQAIGDGYPAWVNFLEAVADVVAEAFEDERGKADPRAAASAGKYKRMLAKYKKRRKG